MIKAITFLIPVIIIGVAAGDVTGSA